MENRVRFVITFAIVIFVASCSPSPTPVQPVQETNLPADTPTLPSTASIPPTLKPTLAPTETPTAAPSPIPSDTPIPQPGGVIYYSSDREGSVDIFKLDLSGGTEERVTTDSSADEYFPHLSPDGRWLSYWSSNPDNKFENALKFWNIDEEDLFEIDQALGWSSWAPENNKVAVVQSANVRDTSGNSMVDFNLFIYIVDPNPEFFGVLTYDPGIEYYPAWSPDGKTIAYVADQDGQAKIFLVDPDGQNKRDLFPSGQSGFSPAWSSDSGMIAFINGNETESQVYLINVDGSGLKQVTDGPGIKDDPTWSADGNWIAFLSNQNGDSEIYAIRPDGSGLIQLTDNEFMDENPSWSPGLAQPEAIHPPTEVVTTQPASVTNIQLPEVITDSFGVEMALVPAGEFLMGSEVVRNASPVHTVYLDAFYIDVYEVTNSRYNDCVEAGVCTKPYPTRSSTRQNYYVMVKFDDFPVINIGRDEARAYCQWRGGDLPSEAQWEKAARGGLEGKIYPWGDEEPTCQPGAANGAHFSTCDPHDTVEIGSFSPNGYGLFDMAGNISEFVLDWYGSISAAKVENPVGPATGQANVIRGGGWNWSEELLAVAYRNFSTPPATLLLGPGSDVIGFRCAFNE